MCATTQYDETFWSLVQDPMTPTATPTRGLPFFKELRRDFKGLEELRQEVQLQHDIELTYDRIIDELDRHDQDQELAHVLKTSRVPKHRILEAMRLMKCTPTFATEMFEAIEQAHKEVREEARRAWSDSMARHEAQRDANRIMEHLISMRVEAARSRIHSHFNFSNRYFL